MPPSKFLKFATEVLGLSLWPKQEEILRALEKPHARISVVANNGCGKTYLDMACALTFAACYPKAIVLVMSPTWQQTKRNMMEKVGAFLRDPSLRQTLFTPKQNEDEIRVADSVIYSLSSNVLERLQGYHAEHLLILIDEATGVSTEFFEAFEGISAAGDARWLLTSNPTRTSGYFYESQSSRNKTFKKFKISAFDTPNLLTPRKLLPGFRPFTIEELLAMDDEELNQNPWPMLTSRRFVRDAHINWFVGKRALWQQRVMGEFADFASDTLFPIIHLEACCRPCSADPRRANYVVGIDPSQGSGGDATGLVIASGNNILRVERIEAGDNLQATLEFLRPYKAAIGMINLDVVGMGAGWLQPLRAEGYRVEKIAANGAPRYHNDIPFRNLKAERFVSLSQKVHAHLISGITPDLMQELSAITQRSNAGDGAVEIASKIEVKKVLGHSPDLAEAAMLALGGFDPELMAELARSNMKLMSTAGVKNPGRIDNLGEELDDPYDTISELGLNRTGAGIANRRVRGLGGFGPVRTYGRFRNF